MNGMSDQQLDALLLRAFAGPVRDDGFSEQVTRALPQRPRQQPWLLLIAAVAGSLLAWLTLLPSALLRQAASEWLAGGFGADSAAVCMLLLGVSVLGCGWALDES